MYFFLLFLLHLYLAQAVDVELSFANYNWPYPDAKSLYSSVMVPKGYDPKTSYWGVFMWSYGYFGIQNMNGSANYIMSVWNDGNKTARVDLGLLRGEASDCENAKGCIEGAVAHDLVFSEPWQTGVQYNFMLDCEGDGETRKLSSYVFKNDH
ncbi:hypothetical protein K7432_016139, partial [Basidiobolus ranarum]